MDMIGLQGVDSQGMEKVYSVVMSLIKCLFEIVIL
jgi:hypothetical protein